MYSAVGILATAPEQLNKRKDAILISYLARYSKTKCLAGGLDALYDS